MYGHFVHEAVMQAYAKGKLTRSAVSMHFVTDPKGDKENYDKGPVIFRYPVKINADDTPETLAKRLNAIEHAWQPYVTNMVVNGLISWSGKSEDEVIFPNPLLYPYR
jgi:phosphoribosylglycinamide formyltransferase-1